jgi:hypothetical protein
MVYPITRYNLTVKLNAYRIASFYPDAGTGTVPAPDPVFQLLKALGAGSGTGSVPVPASG